MERGSPRDTLKFSDPSWKIFLEKEPIIPKGCKAFLLNNEGMI